MLTCAPMCVEASLHLGPRSLGSDVLRFAMIMIPRCAMGRQGLWAQVLQYKQSPPTNQCIDLRCVS
eukprot:5411545-Amphidinium_carterae.1